MPSLPNVEEICEQLLQAVGHTRPPTDLTAVCSLWPDLEVNEEELDREGYLIPLGNLGAEILIRRKDPLNRKKFTLAHELGHWTLANLTADQVFFDRTNSDSLTIRMAHKTGSPEEAWCNKFAACLLMPVRDIRDYLKGVGQSNLPEKISRGHFIFKVAEEAFLSRVRETTPISIFEVVSFDGRVRVRRSYFNASEREEQVKEIVDGLLDNFHRTNGLPRGPVSSGDCLIQTTLTRNSQYSRSWLVTVAPAAYCDEQSRHPGQVENHE